MATKAQAIDLHTAHPDWMASRIARELDCSTAYVRLTFARNGLTLPFYRTAAQRSADLTEAAELRRKAASYVERAKRFESRADQLETRARKGLAE